MGLSMKEKRSVVREVRDRYLRSKKSEKGELLNEFCALTGYNRSYASHILKHGGGTKKSAKKPLRRMRRRFYDQAVASALKRIWWIMDNVCGKRLAPNLGEIVRVLEKFGEIRISAATRKKLEAISAATIDRILAEEKGQYSGVSRSRTKPGTLLKNQIPIRTFSEWDEKRPGFVEIDLVGHDGGDGTGDFAQTLDVTDVCTGWTETEAVRNKAQIHVFEALLEIRKRLPFQILGIDSDNGSEFINEHLLRYCQARQITFTRSRCGRKNDNCFVEQKNYSIVRRNVGYMRHDTEAEIMLLNRLYKSLRLYTNYFQPVMKLVVKERHGARVRKRYDVATTPYHRLLASAQLDKQTKIKLRKRYAELNPAALKLEITQLQNQLIEMVTEKQRRSPRKRPKRYVPVPSHPWRSRIVNKNA